MNEAAFFAEILDLFPAGPPPRSIASYVQGRRIMGTNTVFPGFWDENRTPYWNEVLEDLSPFSPVQHEVVMCSAQIGKTSTAENVCLYYIGAVPSEILFVTATETLADEWSIKRLDPALESMGLANRIFAQTTNTRSRLSGNTIRSKMYVGGSINVCSAQSASDLRSASKRILIRDEIDGAPPELRSGEGNWLAVSEARTTAWSSRRKIFDISTPKTFEDSLINKEYELGDMRLFHVPCPRCGKYQALEMGSRESQHGLKGKFKGEELVEAVYLCAFCHAEIRNSEKPGMFAKGKWIASKKSSNPFLVSRHLNALYSPLGMTSWTQIFRSYLEAQGDPSLMRAFTNLTLGIPFKESGARPQLQTVLALRGSYKSGTIPGKMYGDVWGGPLYLTLGADVQEGSAKDPDLPPRIEVSILGVGNYYRTWAICHKVFPGAVDNAFAGAWEDLNIWAENGGLTFMRADGTPFSASFCLIDSGYLPDTVQKFCRRWQSCAPSKGFGFLIRKAKEKADIPGAKDYRRFRPMKIGQSGEQWTWEISTNWYKKVLYGNLAVAREPHDPQAPGFAEFPYDFSEEYFEQLRGEEMRSDGSFVKIRGRNEALDCRVLAMAAGDIFLDKVVGDRKTQVRAAGGTPLDIERVDARYMLQTWERRYPWRAPAGAGK